MFFFMDTGRMLALGGLGLILIVALVVLIVVLVSKNGKEKKLKNRLKAATPNIAWIWAS